MSRPCKCECVWVSVWSRSECVFWRVYSCIEPGGVHLKLLICNVPFLQRGLPRHKDLIYWFMLALVSTVILLFFTCVLRFLQSSSSATVHSAWFHASHLPSTMTTTTPSHKCNVFVVHSIVKAEGCVEHQALKGLNAVLKDSRRRWVWDRWRCCNLGQVN